MVHNVACHVSVHPYQLPGASGMFRPSVSAVSRSNYVSRLTVACALPLVHLYLCDG